MNLFVLIPLFPVLQVRSSACASKSLGFFMCGWSCENSGLIFLGSVESFLCKK